MAPVTRPGLRVAAETGPEEKLNHAVPDHLAAGDVRGRDRHLRPHEPPRTRWRGPGRRLVQRN